MATADDGALTITMRVTLAKYDGEGTAGKSPVEVIQLTDAVPLTPLEAAALLGVAPPRTKEET